MHPIEILWEARIILTHEGSFCPRRGSAFLETVWSKRHVVKKERTQGGGGTKRRTKTIEVWDASRRCLEVPLAFLRVCWPPLEHPGLPGSFRPQRTSVCGSRFGQRSYEDFGEGVGSGAADVAHGGVERHVVDGLVELLPVSRELLDARLALHVPQTHRAVVTWDTINIRWVLLNRHYKKSRFRKKYFDSTIHQCAFIVFF